MPTANSPTPKRSEGAGHKKEKKRTSKKPSSVGMAFGLLVFVFGEEEIAFGGEICPDVFNAFVQFAFIV
jgi:hypothetical protein